MKIGKLFLVLLFATICLNVQASELVDDYFDIASNYYAQNNRVKALEYLDLILTFEPQNIKATELKNKITPTKIVVQEPVLPQIQQVELPQVPAAKEEKPPTEIKPTKQEIKTKSEIKIKTENKTRIKTKKVCKNPPKINKKKLDKIVEKALDKNKEQKEEDKSPVIIIQSPLQPVLTPQTTTIEIPLVNLDKLVYNSDYYNSKGLEFYNKNEIATAIQYFNKSILLDKKNERAYNNLAMCFWTKGDYANAIKYFKKANSLKKVYTQPLVNLSNLYLQIQNEQSALLYLNKAIKYNKNDYMAYFYLGNYYKKLSNYAKAIENYKEAIKINLKFNSAYLNLAVCFYETEEFNYAILTLKEYEKLCPKSDYAYYLMTKASIAQSRYKEAKDYIQSAIFLRECDDYKIELAKIDYYLEEYDLAQALFEEILEKNDNAEVYNYLGLCLYKQKNINEAIINFKKAIEIDGLRPIYYYNLAQCYKSTGDKKNYVKYINTATKINPINYQDFIDLSYIYYDNSNSMYALNSLNNAIKLYPNAKPLYLAKLKIYESLGDMPNYNKTKKLMEERFNKNEKEKSK